MFTLAILVWRREARQILKRTDNLRVLNRARLYFERRLLDARAVLRMRIITHGIAVLLMTDPFHEVMMHFFEALLDENVVKMRFFFRLKTFGWATVCKLLVKSMDVSESLCKHYRHILVQVLMARIGFLQAMLDELVRTPVILLDVGLEPRQVEPVETEGEQVKQWLEVVDWSCCSTYLEFADGGKHWITLESGNMVIAIVINPLGVGKVDQKILAFVVADVIQL